MVETREVARGIFRIGPIPTGNPRTAGAPTTPYVMVGQKWAAILEPGEEGQALPTLQACEEIGITRDRIAYITVSHIHGHHLEAVNVHIKETPAKLVVHQRAVPYLIDTARLNTSLDQVWGTVGGHCTRINPVPEDRILGCNGGEVFDLGEREFEVIDSRGHAPHHICVFDRMTRAMWTGDMGGQYGSERTNPDILPPLFHVDMIIDSIRRCQAFKPSMLLSFAFPYGISFNPDWTLEQLEEDILDIERICRDGMKNKLTAKEIGQQVAENRARKTQTYSPLIKPRRTESQQARGMYGVLVAAEENQAPFGILAYLKQKDPSLPWPEGMPAPAGAGRGL